MVSSKDAIIAASTLSEFCKEQRMNCCDCLFGQNCLFKICPSAWKLEKIKRIDTRKPI